MNPAEHSDAADHAPDAVRKALDDLAVNSHLMTGSRAELARATRTIIDELMRSMADDAQFDDAAALVGQAAELLRAQTHGRGYIGVAEGSLTAGPHNFVDYSPFIGALNPLAPPIAMKFEGDTVVGRCTYGAAYEGPPGCLHGGFIAAGFDEVLGFAQALSGHRGMTGNLNISYRSPTPLFEEVRYVAHLDRMDGRKIYASATLSAGTRLCAEAQGLFISMKPSVFDRLLRSRSGNSSADVDEG